MNIEKKKRKKSSGSPTQRSLKYLRDLGHTVAVVEKFNRFANVRQDLFGFIDIVALDGMTGLLGVQTTSNDNVSAHIHKAMLLPNLVKWLQAGNRFDIHGWAKKGKQGKRKLWEIRIVSVDLASVKEYFDRNPPNFSGEISSEQEPPS